MFKKILAIVYFVFCFSSISCAETFRGSASYNINFEKSIILKREEERLESGFKNLNYKVQLKPQSLISKEDFPKTKRQNSIRTNLEKTPSSYEVSFSTEKTKALEKTDNIENLANLYPNNKDFVLAYAIKLKEQNELNLAYEKLQLALELDPDFALAHFLAGDILRNQNKYREAAKEYLWAAQINPYCSDAYYNVAKILELVGDKSLALDYYRLAYEINPNDKEIREILIRCYYMD